MDKNYDWYKKTVTCLTRSQELENALHKCITKILLKKAILCNILCCATPIGKILSDLESRSQELSNEILLDYI